MPLLSRKHCTIQDINLKTSHNICLLFLLFTKLFLCLPSKPPAYPIKTHSTQHVVHKWYSVIGGFLCKSSTEFPRSTDHCHSLLAPEHVLTCSLLVLSDLCNFPLTPPLRTFTRNDIHPQLLVQTCKCW